jgi:glycosyltransferase involved in cell wall biosynthesis
MMRVLQAVPTLLPGGAERIAADLAISLGAHGIQSAVVTLDGPRSSALEEALRSSGVALYYLHKRPGFDARMFGRLSRLFRDFRPHVVHTHLAALRYVIPALRLQRIPAAVHTIHNLAEQEVEPQARWINRLAFRAGVAPVSIAQEVESSFKRLYGYMPAALIPNGIPIDRYARPCVGRGSWRAEAGFTNLDLLVVCVARLSQQKNHALLINAFAQAAESCDRLHLVLVGDGELRALLENQAADLGISERVHFTGVRRDVPNVLGACDIFAMSSNWEGNPLSVMEAMAAGLPVISTAVGGVPELVEDGVTGILVRPNDPVDFTASIKRLAANGALRQRMAAESRRKALEEFSLDRMTRSYADLYSRLLTDRGGRIAIAAPCRGADLSK